MNDRFKYRVWDKENECWLEDERVSINIDGTLTVLGTDQYGEDCFLNGEDFIVEQCTGLKDKNGKLIYEGDIVRAFGFTESYILVCRFRKSSFCLEHVDGRPHNFVHSVAPVEVIGNIHENPELLEK